ncbi:phosphatidate cytidylyltransferase [Adhaeretor mobilis]|uniref:Phosphatidate cytidylyltransferase n=1 Tax=Adhaeretor mobilis TaxID=1930276 RepID=A0A517MSK7_9BACT|nr:phosphatidate cytidylyltransferase [Adhaeretor mobilis]QDS97849.1 Phosphatidate cytidylyltransferase [Adhaeretor mobilis]
MLRWRIPLGILFVAILAALGYADAHAGRPGIYLAPLAVLLSTLATGEMRRLHRSGQSAVGSEQSSRPDSTGGSVIYLATLLPVIASCAPLAWKDYPTDCPVGRLGWLALGLLAGLLVIFVDEMRRYPSEEKSIPSLARGTLCVLYVGGLFGMIVQLRLLPGTEALPGGKRGLVALLTMIAIVKASDIGQYTFGRLFGKHKLAPALSPGKTIEGALGGIVTGVVVAALLAKESLFGNNPSLVVLAAYAVLVVVAGILGDLAESLLKRDASVKDSSDWLPGFGGVLDLVDSLLFAAPVAYFFWVSGWLA